MEFATLEFKQEATVSPISTLEANKDFVIYTYETGIVKCLIPPNVQLQPHSSKIYSLCLHPKLHLLASLSYDKVSVTDLINQGLRWTMQGSWLNVCWLDANQKLVLSNQQFAEIWELGKTEPENRIQFQEDAHQVITLPNDELVAFGFQSKFVVYQNSLSNQLLSLPYRTLSLHFKSNSEIIAVDKHAIKIITIATGIVQMSIPIAMSPDYCLYSEVTETIVIVNNLGVLGTYSLVNITEQQQYSLPVPIYSCALRNQNNEDMLYIQHNGQLLSAAIRQASDNLQLDFADQWNLQTNYSDQISDSTVRALNELKNKMNGIVQNGPSQEKLSQLIQEGLNQRNKNDMSILRQVLPETCGNCIRDEFSNMLIPKIENDIKLMMHTLYVNFDNAMREIIDRSQKEEAKFTQLNKHLKDSVTNLNALASEVSTIAFKVSQLPRFEGSEHSQEIPIQEPPAIIKEIQNLLNEGQFETALMKAFDDDSILKQILSIMNAGPLTRKISSEFAGALIIRLLQIEFESRNSFLEALVLACPTKGAVAKQIFSQLEKSSAVDGSIRKIYNSFKERIM